MQPHDSGNPTTNWPGTTNANHKKGTCAKVAQAPLELRVPLENLPYGASVPISSISAICMLLAEAGLRTVGNST